MTSQARPVVRFDPRNDAQTHAQRLYASSDVLFLVGAAGTGKTHAAIGLAMLDVLKGDSRRNRICLTRPLVEAGEGIGFLKGNLDAKLDPWFAPFADVYRNLFFGTLPVGLVERVPFAYMRGRTFQDCVAILDEAQNVTLGQWRLYLSRLGRNAKIIACGDPGQSDLNRSPLSDVVRRLDGLTGVAHVQFPADQCVRHSLVSEIISRLNGT